ncbi:hypothetical protein SAMN02745857_02156 [Andreprevotia lacus DSM 23236]|jgi:uncharacterized protein YfaS (alpha-2-macroglobulin family)|uniref:Alpha-2-macroglobulin family N-terminal region n=1 Tax=Andreprevotia lacus DSM 23236 TaxID=1121001 RepID=A0A1W1XNE9_9NEIS|nr:alpha-2-macroglobulin [Andreprevotia lacus]SMC25392.1 hypothetical protein SAMN02745857_02156 [Andreprevotia lacus DSM 23236]
MRLTKPLIAVVAAIAFAASAGVVSWHFISKSKDDVTQQIDPNTAFAVLEAANRSYDGSPALALTVTQPLESGQDFDKLIQVFEMGKDGKANPTPTPEGEDGAAVDASDEDQAQPKVALDKSVSSAPADVATNGGKAVKGGWVLGDNPRMLYLPNVKPETRYVIVVSSDLKDKAGHTLGGEQRYSVNTAAVAPAYYFASNGMVLPAGQNGGLPVITVNVPEVDVQFLRVRKEQMPRFLDMVIAGPRKAKQAPADGEDDDADAEWRKPYSEQHHELHGAVGGWELDPLHKMTDSIYQARFVTEQKANKQSVTFLPVEDIKELKEPGIYVAIMSKPGRFGYDYQTTYFYVSDLGLSLHVYPKGTTALVSSLTSGKAQSGVTVSWLDGAGKLLGSAKTDSDGRADFAERPAKARLAVAEKDGQISLLALKEPSLDLSEYDISGDLYKPVRLFAYSGRDLYRPGEQFDVSIIARDADGHPVPPQPIQATLRRPDGHNQLVSTLKPNPQHPGYYQQHVEIPLDAPTGVWSLELRSDPADKQPGTVLRFNAEEFLPERMKLDLSSNAARLQQGTDFTIDVNGSYLYGAPAAGNRLLGTVEYQRSRNPLAAKLPGYLFGSVDDDNVAKRVELDETALDDQGKTQVEIDTQPAAGRNSPITIRSTLSLLESGGRPVIRSLERVWWPSDALYGVRPKFSNDYVSEDALAEFDVVLANADARLLGHRAVPVRLIRENRDWYWRYDDQRGWNSGFVESSELITTQSVDITAGKAATLKLPVKYGRYRVEVGTPGAAGSAAYRFYAGWSAQRDQSDGVRPDRVALKLDKPSYQDGDTAHLTIAAPHRGEAIVAVEGDRLLWMKRIHIDSDSQQLDIPLDASWKRQDMYVSVTVLRPGNAGDLVTPTRALGLVHLALDRSKRKLAVNLAAPDKVLPETTVPVQIKVPAAQGQKAIVTLSAVDEGILNITSFKTPDPFQSFFGQLRYATELRDIYGRLIEKMAGKKGKLRFGGDASLKQPPKSPQKVKLVDLFSGPVQLDAKGNATVPLKLPDFNGRLRLMAVVSAPDQFGAAERSMVVAAPMIAEMNTPRFIALGDNATLALDLHNMSGSTQALKITVTAGNGLTLSGAPQAATLKDKEKATLRFAVAASGAPGLVDLRVQVEGNKIALDRHFALEVEAPTPPQQTTSVFAVPPGESITLKHADAASWYPGRSTQLMLSALPPLNAKDAVQGLLHYPYGCAEQTTSSSYPWLFVDEAAAKQYGVKSYTRAERAAVLDKSFAKLGAYQAPNGGFSLWGDASAHDYWLSAYVTRFLQDAREQGFAPPQAMYDKAIGYLQEQMPAGIATLPTKGSNWNGASNWQTYWDYRNRNFEALAQGALVLAQDRKIQLGTLRQLFEVRGNANSALSLVQLGVALQLMGDAPRAQTAISEALAKSRINASYWYDYGSDLRDAAMSWLLLDKYKLNSAGSGKLLGNLAELSKSRRYLSTQEQMALFLAARRLEGSEGDSWSATLSGAEDAELTGKTAQYRALPQASGEGYTLKNTGSKALFVVMSAVGHPRQVSDSTPGLSIERKYFTADGKPLGNNPTLKTGQTIWVEVLTNANRFMPNALIVDRVPAGLEIENTHLIQGEKGDAVKIDDANPVDAMADQRIVHVEFRDDRFVAAVRLGSWWNDRLRLFYRARVVTPGKFVIPQSLIEDMYDPQTHAASAAPGTLQVEDANAPRKAPVKSETDSIPPAAAPAQQ